MYFSRSFKLHQPLIDRRAERRSLLCLSLAVVPRWIAEEPTQGSTAVQGQPAEFSSEEP